MSILIKDTTPIEHMKKIMNIIKVFLAVFLAAGTFSACTKDDPEEVGKNEMTMTGLSTGDIMAELGDCDAYIDAYGWDGITFYLYDTEGNYIADIECAYSHKGESIDLSVLDSCQNEDKRYSFSVAIPYDNTEFDLWGGKDNPILADKGYMKFNEKDGVYTIDMDVELDNIHLKIYFKGPGGQE